jgi:uncharacterized repeat protein (TIGR03803 family)
VEGSDGNFYGATFNGGLYGYNTGADQGDGTIFRITAGGELTTLYNFSGSDGRSPMAGVVPGSDGNFYGTTLYGGANDAGTVFSITPAGVLTTLYSFSGSDGQNPRARLVQGSDGNFYGTTYGASGGIDGSVFQITPAGVLTNLHIFTGGDGQYPDGGLVQGSDGSFYGTTVLGGAINDGTVFKLTVTVVAPVPLPVITSPKSASAEAGKLFSYRIEASHGPLSFAAGGLPAGLNLNAATGLVSGKPKVSGTFDVVLRATNASGTATARLTLKIAVPVVTLKVSVGNVTEGGDKKGEFTLTLSAPQTKLVIVHYKLEGSALDGTDYRLLSSIAKFKPGMTIKHVYVVPIGDLEGAVDKVVELQLEVDPGYTVGTQEPEKVKILAKP